MEPRIFRLKGRFIEENKRELMFNSLHCMEFLDISHIFHRARHSNLSFLQFQQACSPNNQNFSAKDAILLEDNFILIN